MIEWEEGAVCYADEQFWIGGRKNGWDYLLDAYDFQLNEIRQGDYIEAFELETEQKYNDAINVFELFGYYRGGNYTQFKESYDQWADFLVCDNDMNIWASRKQGKRKIAYHQLMAIGKLKRAMIECEKSAPKTAPDLTPDFENKQAKKRKSKQAYHILESMGIEWDNVQGKWFKKEWL